MKKIENLQFNFTKNNRFYQFICLSIWGLLCVNFVGCSSTSTIKPPVFTQQDKIENDKYQINNSATIRGKSYYREYLSGHEKLYTCQETVYLFPETSYFVKILTDDSQNLVYKQKLPKNIHPYVHTNVCEKGSFVFENLAAYPWILVSPIQTQNKRLLLTKKIYPRQNTEDSVVVMETNNIIYEVSQEAQQRLNIDLIKQDIPIFIRGVCQSDNINQADFCKWDFSSPKIKNKQILNKVHKKIAKKK